MKVLSDIDLIRINGYIVLKSTRQQPMGVKRARALLIIVDYLKDQGEGVNDYQVILQKAAALFIHLAKRKVFYTANVATAWIAMVVFLEINGCRQKFPNMTALYFANRMSKSTKCFGRLKKEIVEFLEKSPHVYDIRGR